MGQLVMRVSVGLHGISGRLLSLQSIMTSKLTQPLANLMEARFMSRVFKPALLRLILCAALLGALGGSSETIKGTTSSFSGYIIAVG